MTDMDLLWSQTAAREGGDVPADPETDPAIPDGEYDAEILDFRCFLSKKGAWWMKWVMAVRGGLLDGRLLVRFVEVKATTASFLKSDVICCLGREAAFGGELADVSRGLTGPAGREMIGAVVRARKRSRRADNGKTYLDVYINEGVRLAAGPPVDDGWEMDSETPMEPPEESAPALPSQPSRDSRFSDVPFPDDSDAPPPSDDEDDEIPF